jgi:hypothetical protein
MLRWTNQKSYSVSCRPRHISPALSFDMSMSEARRVSVGEETVDEVKDCSRAAQNTRQEGSEKPTHV